MKVLEKDLPQYKDLELYILSDLHIGDRLVSMKQFNKWKDEVLSQKNRYVVLNGDLINNATRHGLSDIYAETKNPNEAINYLVSLLKPLKDRILVTTEGNHEGRSNKDDGILIMDRVTRELGIANTYSQGAYLLFLSFGINQNRNNRKTCYSIYGKHGAGGGRKMGAKAIRLVEMQDTIDADIYIHSHTHVPMTTKTAFYRSDYRNKKVTRVEHTFINTNAWLTFGGYGEEKGFSPSSTAYPKLFLSGVEREVKVLL